MAIGAIVRPSLIAHGFVQAVAPRYAFDEKTRRRTHEVIGYSATIAPEGGAPVQVSYTLDDVRPTVGEYTAVHVDVRESQQYGASLVFARNVIVDDLDMMNSSLAAPVKA